MGAAGAAICGLSQHASAAADRGAVRALGDNTARDVQARIDEVVQSTRFVDTHEHLLEEAARFDPAGNPFVKCDDWSVLVGGYLFSDFVSAGLPPQPTGPNGPDRLFTTELSPQDKWRQLEPYWPAVRNTGYGLALRESVKRLYDIDTISAETIPQIQERYEATRVPGFYQRILCDVSQIESCQVNSFVSAFLESKHPTLLMQDINAIPFFATNPFGDFAPGWTREGCRAATGITVSSLSDWHKVIDWWFAKYGPYAVAVKSQLAYTRDIDHARVAVDVAEPAFGKLLSDVPLTDAERKAVEDHLFWYVVAKAAEHKLPVKLHTGYYAGENNMPLARLIDNPASACELCRAAPETPFVFMHICYPYYEELLAVAKQYTNAYVDMCWAWIVNPIAAKDFLKKYLVTAPANKLLSFGADYVYAENVVGHAVIARRGITLALAELVTEGWIDLDEALHLVPQLMHGNARRLFQLEAKTQRLARAPWL
jgi:hypothetical protein